MAPQIDAPLTLIIWWPIVDVLQSYDSEISSILRGSEVHWFADGSVGLGTSRMQSIMWLKLEHYRQSGLLIRQNTQFRSLACFEPAGFQLLTTGKYFDQIGGERDLLITPTRFNLDVDQNEMSPSNLNVQVAFWRQPSKALRQLFFEALYEWEMKTSSNAFAGKKVAFIRKSLSFEKKRATFRINIANGGQGDIIWLILSVLRFGGEKAAISEILFAWLR